METHYVYSIDDPVTGEFYYGVRSFDGRPEEDCYMSSKKAWRPEDETRLKKHIIRDDFATRDEANVYEVVLIELHIDHPLNRNAHIPGVGFCTKGVPTQEERKREHSERMRGENNPSTKLNWEKIREIRRLYATGDYLQKELADIYGVAQSIISSIVINKIWTDNEYNGRKNTGKGEDHPSAKLNWEKVKEIRRLYATGDYTHQQLADTFGVIRQTISDIITNKRWKI